SLTVSAEDDKGGRAGPGSVHTRSVRTLHYRVRLVHQHRLRGFELERVSPADSCRLLYVGFRCGYDRCFGQVRRFPALGGSCLHGRGWSSDLEGYGNEEYYASTRKKKEVVREPAV